MEKLIEVHFEGKIAQKAIIVNEGAVLLVSDPRTPEVIWELPGGRLNMGEEPRQGLKRELFEELGVWFDIHEVIHMEQFKQGSEDKNAFLIVYRATKQEENTLLAPDPAEVRDVCFVSALELAEIPIYEEHKRAIALFYQLPQTTL
jgi:ADP-ribose pyrophosphatase YjhB (NUDIX family)